MKIHTILLVLFCMLTAGLKAQVVTEEVHFDFYQSSINNDLANNFSNGLGMTQIQTNGITGGCVTVPDSISWGNDNAVYCSHYHPNSGDTTVTSINFKYNSGSVVLSSYQRAISIFLRPSADFNHYVIATVSGNKNIELITYGWVNTPYPNLNLLDNHWYNYRLTTAFFSSLSQVYIRADVFDLGLTGTSIPSLVNSSSGTITDNILAADTSIDVSITGASYGGCLYLDDFRFHGRKGLSNCASSTGMTDYISPSNLNMLFSSAENTLHISNFNSGNEMHVSVFNAEGKKVVERNANSSKFNINLSSLANGFYTVQCTAGNEIKNLKLVVNK